MRSPQGRFRESGQRVGEDCRDGVVPMAVRSRHVQAGSGPRRMRDALRSAEPGLVDDATSNRGAEGSDVGAVPADLAKEATGRQTVDAGRKTGVACGGLSDRDES